MDMYLARENRGPLGTFSGSQSEMHTRDLGMTMVLAFLAKRGAKIWPGDNVSPFNSTIAEQRLTNGSPGIIQA